MRNRKCNPAGSSLTETDTIADTSYAKSDSRRETSVNKQAVVASDVSVLKAEESPNAIGMILAKLVYPSV